jgi:hypothetical protein
VEKNSTGKLINIARCLKLAPSTVNTIAVNEKGNVGTRRQVGQLLKKGSAP